MALVLALAACGQGVGSSTGASGGSSATCQLLGDPAAFFGANAVVSGYAVRGDIPGSCEFQSADGTKAGEIVAIEHATAAQLQDTLEKWSKQTATPLVPVDGLGEGAQMATDLPGYQTQIAFLKGTTLILIQAHTAELASAKSADLAKRMATTVAAAMH